MSLEKLLTMGIFEIYRKKKDENRRFAAENIYQVKEYGGELWITYNNGLVCPTSMLKVDPVEALKKMRELFIQRDE